MGFFNKLFGKNKKAEEIKEEEKIVKNEEIKLEKKDEKKTENLENIEKYEEKIISEKKENKKEDVIIKKREEEIQPEKNEGFFASLKEKLFRTREGLFGKIKNIFSGRTVIDEELYEELEDLLIQSDIGMDMTVKIVNALEKEVKSRGIKDPAEIYSVLKEVMTRFLIDGNNKLDIREGEMNVILVVGVNGVGKTTTIGKIAKKLKNSGKKVIIGAADTFRAAAVEQLEEWGKRADVEVIKKEEGSDPGAVVYDTIQAGLDKKADVVIIDTAGRLHNKSNLMKELEKINNIIIKKLGHSRYESILVIDGTTGQNGLIQAKVFNEATKLTGFIVTKLDGTAKGGIVFSISEEIKKPIKYIGVGEKIDDLREFNTKDYIEAIFD
ncbi:signal recognition particle-docking protein FtsY [Fusobacterium perfoetens]|uniref:signal recognition particle-docking protein FtsY n=1 Tax=Fusobacterium perfoetens TaxID=852 RepID=UPI001F2B8827|nr:signal recognition particle-docking protein FtsY [Fusobacterium perfoetens]MCF2624761.1 signal recognition particle-docking protein FtsY [Fusobacterium perfoetens]